ncbi:zf-PARP-domain-containing protein [Athelia psychrophila]|uniref:Zf-PARP-domain-containing protein n=1 Tax=Athelia psychrophila TaxID=1759441 RepID=A0A166P3E5_9AGAM|nr:zf-PARP-domain-containing protein [Fibularhizoctonia sp. CBS 109695]
MSDNEGSKKSGYRLEYASTGRAKCKGPKPCAGTPIAKGAVRLGSLVDMAGHTSFAWRHWGCTTKMIIANMKKSFTEASELDGYEDLRPEDQEKIDKAWVDGHVADEDIPATAIKPAKDGEEDEEEKPKKKRAPPKKKAVKADEDDDEDEEERPKKKRAPPKKKAAKADSDEDDEEPKKKRAPPKKKAPAEKKEKAAPKKRAPKKKKVCLRLSFAQHVYMHLADTRPGGFR